MERTCNPVKICSRIGLGLFAMMVLWLGANYGLTYAVGTFAPRLLRNEWIVWLLNDVPLYFIGMPVFLLVLRSIPDGPDAPRTPMKLGFGRFLLVLVFCFGATYFFNIITMGLQTALEAIIYGFGFEGSGWLAESMLDQVVGFGGIIPTLLFGAVVPALGEEFIFRWMLRRKLRGASDKLYIFFSAFCFAVFHINLGQMLYAFVLGAAFAWLFVRTGKLWLTMVIHFLVNTLGLVVAPRALGNTVAEVVLALFMMIAILMAVVLFFVFRKPVFYGMRAAGEAGWPFKPKQKQVAWLAQQELAEEWKKRPHTLPPQAQAPAGFGAGAGPAGPGIIPTGGAPLVMPAMAPGYGYGSGYGYSAPQLATNYGSFSGGTHIIGRADGPTAIFVASRPRLFLPPQGRLRAFVLPPQDAPAPTPAERRLANRGGFGVCFGNLGVALYAALAIAMTAVNFILPLL